MIKIGDEFVVKIKVYDCDDADNPSDFGVGFVNSNDLLWIDKAGLIEEIAKLDVNQKRMLIQRQIEELQKQLEEI